MSPFRPSTIPHPWRQALAVFAILAWLAVGEHWLIAGAVLAIAVAIDAVEFLVKRPSSVAKLQADKEQQ